MASDELVYLDYAATAPVLPEVAARMAEVMAMPLGNASSSHAAGRRALELIEAARAQVAALVGAPPADIVFTSGATESNNLAITGTRSAAQARGGKGHVVTLASEHKSVLEPVRAAGAGSTVLKPDTQGVLDPAVLAAALRPDTCLVSLLHVNNETGTAQDLDALRQLCAERGVPLHIDAAQSAGKLPLDVQGLALLSVSGHKLAGPQGIGALYVSPGHRGRIAPQMLGSAHERGLRAGTLATHQIVGFGLACEIAARKRAQEAARLTGLRERLWQGLADLPGVLRNGRPGAPHILNASFPGVEGESLFTGLSGIALSTGSACNSRSAEPSYVLRALGRDTETAQSSLRFSLGHATTAAHIDAAIAAVRQVHGELWNASPARPAPVPAGQGQQWAGEAGSLQLGTWVRIALRAEGGLVRAVEIRCYGCPYTAAACNLLRQRLPGQPVAGAAVGRPQEWLETLQAPIEKLGRMLIIEDALHALKPID
ncbi:MAG TPA: cysteine desulfurase family protein [Steroidobacteraceae bacterium]|nr:cysteine desulfurase family protein [Steroidobacteraceae bacterium]